MTRIRTTLWDLADAIVEEAERVAEGDEAMALANAALTDFLMHARLVREEPERPVEDVYRRRARRTLRLAVGL
jgi:hypothetical protein